MKAILICPNQAHGIPVLAERKPPLTLPFLGQPFICYWLKHLAERGVKELRLLTSEDPEQTQEIVGSGERWGMNLEIFHEVRDLEPAEARKRYRPSYETDWLPEDVIEADHLPGLKEHKVFSDYGHWFKAMALWLPSLPQANRLGLREIEPGVWAGARARIGRGTKFQAPCWLGDNVRLGAQTVLGPFAFLEDRVVLDHGVEVRNSWVGPDTFLGSLVQLNESLAWGNLLINWSTGSHTLVPDAFLMASLVSEKKRTRRPSATPSAAAAPSPLSRPFDAVISLAQKLQS